MGVATRLLGYIEEAWPGLAAGDKTMAFDQLLCQRGVPIELLELIGTSDARKILDRLAAGAPNALRTCEAHSFLKRLAGRQPQR